MSDPLIARLEELAQAVADHRMGEFTMRIPAEPDRDADLVLDRAARRLAELDGALGVLVRDVEAAAPDCGIELEPALHQARAALSGRSETAGIISEVQAELARASRKFPTWPTDPLHALAVLGEEYGELTKAMLQLTYEPHKSSPGHVREEAIQTAAMVLRLALSLDRYEYAPCEQHAQSGRG